MLRMILGGAIVLFISVLSGTVATIYAQSLPPDVTWSKTFGGPNDDFGYSMVQTSDGGYIIAGFTNSSGDYSHWNVDTYLVKTDSIGNLLWEKTFVGYSGDWASSIKQTADGGYIVAGTTNYPYDIQLMKLDSGGNIVWKKTGCSRLRAWNVSRNSRQWNYRTGG